MAKAEVETVDDYIASRPERVQVSLRKLRRILRQALPGSKEVISYQIPAYRLHGRIVLFFAGWSEHYSLYPAGSRLSDSLKKDLQSYRVSRGTIRFELSKPVPEKLITRIAKFRAMQVAAKAKTEHMKNKKKTVSTKRSRSKARGSLAGRLPRQ